MLFVNNSDNSKVSKLIAIVFAISAIIGLVCQIVSLLALTKSKIGKHIRQSLIGTMCDMFDETIDEASKRVPGLMEKLSKLDQ